MKPNQTTGEKPKRSKWIYIVLGIFALILAIKIPGTIIISIVVGILVWKVSKNKNWQKTIKNEYNTSVNDIKLYFKKKKVKDEQ